MSARAAPLVCVAGRLTGRSAGTYVFGRSWTLRCCVASWVVADRASSRGARAVPVGAAFASVRPSVKWSWSLFLAELIGEHTSHTIELATLHRDT